MQQPSGLLDDLAAQLARPAQSGVYLTKNEIIVLARLSDASLRINERPRMLADVLKSADGAEALAALFDRLATFCQASLDAYAELSREYPSCAPALRGFQENAARTVQFLSAARAEVDGSEGDEDPSPRHPPA